MEYVPLAALVLSIIAIAISALSLWNSWRAQHHAQIVSYEQRRQEVRQIFHEGQLIVGERSNELNQAILISEKQLIDGKMSEQQKRKFLEGTKIFRDGISHNAVVRREYETFLKELDQIPSSPSTQARLDLERLSGKANRMKGAQQDLLQKVHHAIQALEDTLKEIQRSHSK